MGSVVYAKTVFGVDELQQRQMRLHPRLRTLLVMVDGKQAANSLIESLSAAGVTEAHLQELQDAGLIQPVLSSLPPAPPASAGLLTVLPDEVPKDESSRLMTLYRLYGEMIRESFGSKAAPFQKKLSECARVGDYIALGNEIIIALNQSMRAEEALIFKTRVKPFLR